MINASYEELDVPVIYVDDVRSGYLATTELLSKGHTEIALVTKIDDLQGKNRMRGYVKAFDQGKRSFRSANIFTYTTETKAELLQKIRVSLQTNEQPITGIVCYNDEIALEIISVAKKLGMKIPDDLSIVGQDDSFMSVASEVKLTTITHPKETMGKDAATWIIDKISEKKGLSNTIKYEPELIQRSSVKRIK